MKKAEFILFENKKDAQILDDIALGPEGRFKKMFALIAMALMLSPAKKLKTFTDKRFIELKRKHDTTA